MLAILVITVTLALPSQNDIDHLAGILCGESCGMPRQSIELVASNLWYDYWTMDDLRTRWYAPEKESELAREIMRETFRDGPSYPRCRLVGSASDKVFWLEHGYVNGEPDYEWLGPDDMRVVGFDCHWPTIRRMWDCEVEMCPM